MYFPGEKYIPNITSKYCKKKCMSATLNGNDSYVLNNTVKRTKKVRKKG